MQFRIHPKEKIYFTLITMFSVLIYLGFIYKEMFTAQKTGNFLLFVFIMAVVNFIMSLLFISHLKGNSIKINRQQFSDIFEILEAHSKKLGLKKVPDMYLLQGNGVLNAFATKFAKRDYVILHSDILEVAYQEGMDAVSFIIGHELGHIKRKHTGFFKSSVLLPAKFIPILGHAYSRACEYTCDNIGYNLSPKGALKGILILAAGKVLYKKINIEELIFNVRYESNFVILFGEIFSTHPALVKRIATIYELNRDNLSLDDIPFVSPKINMKQLDIN